MAKEPCSSVEAWADELVSSRESLRSGWLNCQRGDWLLYLAAKKSGQPGWLKYKKVAFVACQCAESTLSRLTDDEQSKLKVKIDDARRKIETGEEEPASRLGPYCYALGAAANADREMCAMTEILASMASIVRRELGDFEAISLTP